MEPQSAGLFVLLLGVFCALLVWLALTKEPVFRVLAACLAFIPAMLFGMATVNKYYDYYQSWGAVAADFGGQGLNTVPSVPGGITSQRLTAILDKVTSTRTAASDGETVRLVVTGARTRISRAVYVYLPPQYFQAAYQRHRFPVAELVSGYPGGPLDWINVMGTIQAYQTLLRDGAAQPVALVMPDPNGARQISLQCLNVVHGPQDATYLAQDLPDYLSRALRLDPPGRTWAIAGYSEGGYCAANLALLYPGRYGFAGVLSGYFQPLDDRLGSPSRLVDPFGRSLRLRRLNTPLRRVAALPFSVVIPQFWLGAGSSDRADVTAARNFQRLLLPRQPNVTLDLVQGGAHTMPTWRALVPPLLSWLTGRLAAAEQPAPPHAGKTAPAAGRHRPRPAASGR
jgi:enterochelin esterase-like enzyme